MESRATRCRDTNRQGPYNAVEQKRGEAVKRNKVTIEGNTRRYFYAFHTRKMDLVRTEDGWLEPKMVVQEDNHILTQPRAYIQDSKGLADTEGDE